MVTMHGFFNLKDGKPEDGFKQAYDEFAAKLVAEDMIAAYRSMRRSPNKNYDSSPPSTKYYISMDFDDLNQAQRCWDYIEGHEALSHKLHRIVYAQIEDYSFFLSEDIPA